MFAEMQFYTATIFFLDILSPADVLKSKTFIGGCFLNFFYNKLGVSLIKF